MRVLVISNLFPPHALGGYERSCADVVDRWRASGHQVTVLATSHRVDGVAAAEADAEGVERSLPSTSLYGERAPLHRRPAVERAARRVIDDAIDRVKPDVALVWNVAGVPLSAVVRLTERRVPTLFVVADAWPVRSPGADPWVAPFSGSAARRSIGRLMAVATGVPTAAPPWDQLGRWVFCSASLRDHVAKKTGMDFSGAAVVPLGVDPHDFPVDRAGSGRTARSWRWRLLFVGRLAALKGIDTLVRTLSLLPRETTLDVVGPAEPEHVDRVLRLAEDLAVADRIRVASVPRRELAGHYRAGDVCVFPSEWDEPFGIVPLEAMACSTPVAASGTGGSAEYLRDGVNCVLAAPGDPTAIAAALHRLADDPALRARIVEGGWATAASLTADQLASRLEELALVLVGGA